MSLPPDASLQPTAEAKDTKSQKIGKNEASAGNSTTERSSRTDSLLGNFPGTPLPSLPIAPKPLETPKPEILYEVRYVNGDSGDPVYTRTLPRPPAEIETSENSRPPVFKVVEFRSTWLERGAPEFATNPEPENKQSLEADEPRKGLVVKPEELATPHEQDKEKIRETDTSNNELVKVDGVNEVPSTKSPQVKLPPFNHHLNTCIEIHSPAVREALRCVVDYSPGFNLQNRITKVEWPYPVLTQYDKALEEYQKAFEHVQCVDLACPGQYTYQHIQALRDFHRGSLGESIDEELQRHKRGFATFSMLWLLYRPGDEVLFADTGIEDYYSGVISKINWSLSGSNITQYSLRAWIMESDSVEIGPYTKTCLIKEFAGEKAIISLQPRPFRFWKSNKDGQSPEEMRKRLVERGKVYFKLRKKGCWDFNGILAAMPLRLFEGQVMVDLAQFRLESARNCVSLDTAFESGDSKVVDREFCSSCRSIIVSQLRPFRFAGYSRIDVETTKQLTDHQYFLCSRSMPAFLFKTREWQTLHVDGFRPARYDTKMLDTLILPAFTKDMIRSLTAKYLQAVRAEEERQKIMAVPKSSSEVSVHGESAWSADFVKGKGEGLVFLLHGKPGVGKTYTAECIAANAQRPLLALTCADIGTNPEQIENKLVKWFKLAKWWNAIVLLDEADIYMEHRKVQDIERNSLVAGFLRAMEYYKGILFLTTNRVGTFDEAFISRINMPIYYPPFSSTTRKEVWESFFRKLEREKEDTMRLHDNTRDYVQESKELEQLQWNGRDIRNAFQIAVALAETGGEKDAKGRIVIKRDHIQATVEMSKAFKQYMKKLHKKDEDSMAAARGNRYDTPEVERTKETSFR